MELDDYSEEELTALAKELAPHLKEELSGGPTRREVVAGGGVLAALGLTGGYGVGSVEAQTGPAGSQGTPEKPNDMYAWDLDVANQVTSDLDMGGQAIEDAGSVKTDRTTTKELATTLEDGTDISGSRSEGTTYQNAENHDIFVFIQFSIELSSGATNPALRIQTSPESSFAPEDTVDVAQPYVDHTNRVLFCLSGTVPSGYYYRLDSFSSGDWSVVRWTERGISGVEVGN